MTYDANTLSVLWSRNPTRPVTRELVDRCRDRLLSAIRRLEDGSADTECATETIVFGQQLAVIKVQDPEGNPFGAKLRTPPGCSKGLFDLRTVDGTRAILETMLAGIANCLGPNGSGRWPYEIPSDPTEKPVVGAAWSAMDAEGSPMGRYQHPTPWSMPDMYVRLPSEKEDVRVEGPERRTLKLLRPAIVVVLDNDEVELRPYHVHVNPRHAEPIQRLRDIAAWHAWKDADPESDG